VNYVELQGACAAKTIESDDVLDAWKAGRAEVYGEHDDTRRRFAARVDEG
jgi:hypothetical protein